jgi:hypothetical protein
MINSSQRLLEEAYTKVLNEWSSPNIVSRQKINLNWSGKKCTMSEMRSLEVFPLKSGSGEWDTLATSGSLRAFIEAEGSRPQWYPINLKQFYKDYSRKDKRSFASNEDANAFCRAIEDLARMSIIGYLKEDECVSGDVEDYLNRFQVMCRDSIKGCGPSVELPTVDDLSVMPFDVK